MVDWQLSEPDSCVLVELYESDHFRLSALGSARHPWPIGFWQMLASHFIIRMSEPDKWNDGQY